MKVFRPARAKAWWHIMNARRAKRTPNAKDIELRIATMPCDVVKWMVAKLLEVCCAVSPLLMFLLSILTSYCLILQEPGPSPGRTLMIAGGTFKVGSMALPEEFSMRRYDETYTKLHTSGYNTYHLCAIAMAIGTHH